MEKIEAKNIARYFYDKNNEYTPKQLQKLTYYTYALYLAKYKEKAFDERPIIDDQNNSPVFESLIPLLAEDTMLIKNVDNTGFDEETKMIEIIELIYANYGKCSGTRLEQYIQVSSVYKNVKKRWWQGRRRAIKDSDILAYYRS